MHRWFIEALIDGTLCLDGIEMDVPSEGEERTFSLGTARTRLDPSIVGALIIGWYDTELWFTVRERLPSEIFQARGRLVDVRVWRSALADSADPAQSAAIATKPKRKTSINYQNEDVPLVKEMYAMVHPSDGGEGIPPYRAATQLADKAVGGGKHGSRRDRLHRAYRARYPDDFTAND